MPKDIFYGLRKIKSSINILAAWEMVCQPNDIGGLELLIYKFKKMHC
jgi:hypothetical protein